MKKESDVIKFDEDAKSFALADVILGGQDGLVNTLGVILGVAAASGDLRLILAAGFAGSVAEAISMGAVAYTSNIANRDYYLSQLEKEKREIKEIPEVEIEEIREIYRQKGLQGDLLEEVVKKITSNEKVWIDTMMREELKLAPLEENRPLRAGFLVGVSAMIGSLIPLFPFVLFNFLNLKTKDDVFWASMIGIFICAITLFVVGAVKSKMTVGKWYKSGFEMMIIGTVSALAGYVIGSFFGAPV